MAHMMRNTDKAYPCTQCGSFSTNIIREGSNPRLKCNSCNFMFDGSDSLQALQAGAIPDAPPERQDPAEELEPVDLRTETTEGVREGPSKSTSLKASIPRLPGYILISKDRKSFEVTTSKAFKSAVLKWTAEGTKFDVYELQSKAVTAKIDIK